MICTFLNSRPRDYIPCSLIIKKGIKNWKSTITHVCPTTVWGYGWGGLTPNPCKHVKGSRKNPWKNVPSVQCAIFTLPFLFQHKLTSLSLGRTKSLRGDFSQASLWTGERGGQVKKVIMGNNSILLLCCSAYHFIHLPLKENPSFLFKRSAIFSLRKKYRCRLLGAE